MPKLAEPRYVVALTPPMRVELTHTPNVPSYVNIAHAHEACCALNRVYGAQTFHIEPETAP